jgi:BirA family biotin operon repressor/biotin-[acetyl-CoA-carboxylase] ligase
LYWKGVREIEKSNREITFGLNAPLNVETILSRLPAENPPCIYYFDSLASTMDEARRLAGEGAAHGTTVIAGAQTRGRGRLHRAFHSPEGGLYMTMVLKPEALPFTTPTAVTAYAGICVCDAVRSAFGIEAGIKWVNDIMVKGKKTGGILTEALAGSGGVNTLLLGIGINVYTQDFPEEI